MLTRGFYNMGKDRRRNDESRMKSKVKKIFKHVWGMRDLADDEKEVGKKANTPQGCSCRACGNPRKHEKGKDSLTMQERKAKLSDSDELPSTVEEAVELIISEMEVEDISFVRQFDEEDLITLHDSFGRHIRNRLGLWEDNKDLLKDTGKDNPDDASLVIINKIWDRFNP
jgi:hypothetical protein